MQYPKEELNLMLHLASKFRAAHPEGTPDEVCDYLIDEVVKKGNVDLVLACIVHSCAATTSMIFQPLPQKVVDLICKAREAHPKSDYFEIMSEMIRDYESRRPRPKYIS